MSGVAASGTGGPTAGNLQRKQEKRVNKVKNELSKGKRVAWTLGELGSSPNSSY